MADKRRDSNRARAPLAILPISAASAGAAFAAVLLLLTPTMAMASRGSKTSNAPLITVGQHYYGDTYSSGRGTAQLYRLPSLLAADRLTIAWTSTDETELCLAQEVDDYSWEGQLCNGSERYGPGHSGSTSNRSVIRTRDGSAAAFLEFIGGGGTLPQPYDFVVESIQHVIGVRLTPRAYIIPTNTLTARVYLADGSPAPDGLAFWLGAHWGRHGSAKYKAKTRGGTVRFPLRLPRSAVHRTVTFVVVRPAGARYRAAKSVPMRSHVNRARPTHHRHRHHWRMRHGR
jgi:hypothetical protein